MDGFAFTSETGGKLMGAQYSDSGQGRYETDFDFMPKYWTKSSLDPWLVYWKIWTEEQREDAWAISNLPIHVRVYDKPAVVYEHSVFVSEGELVPDLGPSDMHAHFMAYQLGLTDISTFPTSNIAGPFTPTSRLTHQVKDTPAHTACTGVRVVAPQSTHPQISHTGDFHSTPNARFVHHAQEPSVRRNVTDAQLVGWFLQTDPELSFYDILSKVEGFVGEKVSNNFLWKSYRTIGTDSPYAELVQSSERWANIRDGVSF